MDFRTEVKSPLVPISLKQTHNLNCNVKIKQTIHWAIVFVTKDTVKYFHPFLSPQPIMGYSPEDHPPITRSPHDGRTCLLEAECCSCHISLSVRLLGMGPSYVKQGNMACQGCSNYFVTICRSVGRSC